MAMPFKQAFGFRIGMVQPTTSQLHVLPYYKYLAWLVPILKVLTPNIISTMKQVANAMVYFSENGFERNVIFVKDINKLKS